MLSALAGLAAVAGAIILILALVGVIAVGLWVLGVVLLVVGGVVYFALRNRGTNRTVL